MWGFNTLSGEQGCATPTIEATEAPEAASFNTLSGEQGCATGLASWEVCDELCFNTLSGEQGCATLGGCNPHEYWSFLGVFQEDFEIEKKVRNMMNKL